MTGGDGDLVKFPWRRWAWLGGFLAAATIGGFLNWERFLTTTVAVPERPQSADSRVLMYVLGGSAASLDKRFRTAAMLYRKGVARTILLDRDDSETEFSQRLNRNLTANEWATERLEANGVSTDDIELVSLDPGLFGTLQEARRISTLAIERQCDSLILVTSAYHTRRTWLTFSTLLSNRSINLYIYAADDRPSMYSILSEYVKVGFYRVLLST